MSQLQLNQQKVFNLIQKWKRQPPRKPMDQMSQFMSLEQVAADAGAGQWPPTSSEIQWDPWDSVLCKVNRTQTVLTFVDHGHQFKNKQLTNGNIYWWDYSNISGNFDLTDSVNVIMQYKETWRARHGVITEGVITRFLAKPVKNKGWN